MSRLLRCATSTDDAADAADAVRAARTRFSALTKPAPAVPAREKFAEGRALLRDCAARTIDGAGPAQQAQAPDRAHLRLAQTVSLAGLVPVLREIGARRPERDLVAAASTPWRAHVHAVVLSAPTASAAGARVLAAGERRGLLVPSSVCGAGGVVAQCPLSNAAGGLCAVRRAARGSRMARAKDMSSRYASHLSDSPLPPVAMPCSALHVGGSGCRRAVVRARTGRRAAPAPSAAPRVRRRRSALACRCRPRDAAGRIRRRRHWLLACSAERSPGGGRGSDG